LRQANSWPLSQTQWQKWYLDNQTASLKNVPAEVQSVQTYQTMGEGLTFKTPIFEQDIEFTGYVKLKLYISSETTDLDVFAVLRCFDPDGSEVTFIGAHETVPVAMGWLRASHRKLDTKRSQEYLPVHTHDEEQKLVPEQVYELDVEILPTSIVVPKGYRLALTIMGKDFCLQGPGRILHNDPRDRNEAEFGKTAKVLTGKAYESYLLLPYIAH
jgi:predicted acyl esterase